MTEIVLIVARGRNGVIGVDGKLPWHIPADLKRFKALTLGYPVIMGRKTYQSIGRPLPGRRNIVLTRQAGWTAGGVEVADGAEAALALAGAPERIAIIGGAELYRLFLPWATRLEITEVDDAPRGDTCFPDIGPGWREVARQEFAAAGSVPAFAYVTLLAAP